RVCTRSMPQRGQRPALACCSMWQPIGQVHAVVSTTSRFRPTGEISAAPTNTSAPPDQGVQCSERESSGLVLIGSPDPSRGPTFSPARAPAAVGRQRLSVALAVPTGSGDDAIGEECLE